MSILLNSEKRYTIMTANSHIVKPLTFFGAYSAFLLFCFCDCKDVQ